MSCRLEFNFVHLDCLISHIGVCEQDMTFSPPGEGEVLVAIEAAGVNPVGGHRPDTFMAESLIKPPSH